MRTPPRPWDKTGNALPGVPTVPLSPLTSDFSPLTSDFSPLTSERLHPWIQAGYRLFGETGPAGLKVEVLARAVGKNKSSFYHHFADLDIFLSHLLDYHLERAQELAARERACTCLDPDLIELLVAAREDLFFQRQLRVHRQDPRLTTCLEQADRLTGEALLSVWARSLGLEARPLQAAHLLDLVQENFYLQLHEDTLTTDWLRGYFQELHQLVAGLQRPAPSSDTRR